MGYPLGAMLAVAIIDRYERQRLTVCSGPATAIFGVPFAFSDVAVPIVVFGFCYTAASNVFSTTFQVYQVEVVPTDVRARGGGVPPEVSLEAINDQRVRA